MHQAACTPKELKELSNLDASIAIHAAPEQMVVSDEDQAAMKAVRMKRRIYDIISQVRKHHAL